MRPLIDYENIIYDQPHNGSFCEKLESAQYKSPLAITGVIQGTSREKMFRKLDLESLKCGRWFRRLCYMFKIMKNKAPNYLISLIPKRKQTFNARNKHLPTYNWRTDCFKYSFFPCILNDWFNLDVSIRNSESISILESKLLYFVCSVENNVFNIFDPQGSKLLTRLRLGFIHLNEHRFRHDFQECMNPVCSCSIEIEDTSHYLLHCHHFTLHRINLMKSVKSICNNFESMTDNNKITLLLYGDSRFDENKNKFILQSSVKYIKTTERFSGSYFE